MTTDLLKQTISSFINLADMLKTYAGVNKNELISKDEFFSQLSENDTLCIMAEENNMSDDDMKLWLNDNLNNKIKCSIIEEHGPAGGWPVVKVECADKTFFFDWAE